MIGQQPVQVMRLGLVQQQPNEAQNVNKAHQQRVAIIPCGVDLNTTKFTLQCCQTCQVEELHGIFVGLDCF